MEHVVKAVCRDTQELVFEEIFESACKAYMSYHNYTLVNKVDEQYNYVITLDSRDKIESEITKQMK